MVAVGGVSKKLPRPCAEAEGGSEEAYHLARFGRYFVIALAQPLVLEGAVLTLAIQWVSGTICWHFVVLKTLAKGLMHL